MVFFNLIVVFFGDFIGKIVKLVNCVGFCWIIFVSLLLVCLYRVIEIFGFKFCGELFL